MMRQTSLVDRCRPKRVFRSTVLAGLAGFGLVLGQPERARADTPPQADPRLEAVARRFFPADATDIAPRRLFRLTRDQIDATVSSLLPDHYRASVRSVMARDPLQTNYEHADLLGINAANHGGLVKWIGEIAASVVRNPASVISCAASGNAQSCLEAEARRFVVRAFRGDVGETRVAAFTKFYVEAAKRSGLAQATGDLVEVVLNSPDFLFRKEIDTTAANRLDAAQLLEAVTYTIADVPPERLGLDSLKAAQYLGSGDDASANIGAIVLSADAREKLVRFFLAWLEVRRPEDFTISTEVYAEFTPAMAKAMVGDAERALRLHLSKPAPRLSDMTQATTTIVSAATERLYGYAPGSVAKEGAVAQLDTGRRLGIFSEPAVIASHSGPAGTRPIKRGVFWSRKVMCIEPVPPPAGLDSSIKNDDTLSERRRIEISTSRAACAGCHKVINPLGFFLENYDALGRWRTIDHGLPVDSSIEIDFLGGPPVKTSGPVEALQVLTGSAMFQQCFVRQMFRFYMGRNEEPSDDPLLRRMFLSLASGRDDLLDLVYLLASSDRMVRRR